MVKKQESKKTKYMKEKDIESTERAITDVPATKVFDNNLKEYVVDLVEGQVVSIVLTPKQKVTVVLDKDGNFYPECFRSLIHAGTLKEQI